VIGILGGTFNPPHNGHVALARAALARFPLERLLVMVAGTPPHKEVQLDAESRFRLAAAAFAGLPKVELSRFELDRDEPSYTIDTVREAERRFGDVLFLVGADEFADFLSWRDPEGVLEHARLGVATRPGYPRERLDALLARLSRPDRVEVFEIEPLPISSSGIRKRVARGEPIDDLVPPRVAALIRELGLYRD
jgi:nicotinate-nucleotide adenylyltransferase